MNNKLKAVLITVVLAITVPSSFAAKASASHSHVVSKDKIQNFAKRELNRLVSKNKIPTSWKDIAIFQIKKASSEWIVDFKNEKVVDKQKAKISIYLTTYGKVNKATYTSR